MLPHPLNYTDSEISEPIYNYVTVIYIFDLGQVFASIIDVVIHTRKACGLRFTHKFGVIMRSRKTKEIQGKQRVLSRKHASQGW